MNGDRRDLLVLVHGAGRGGRMWRRPARRLSERYRVLTPDLPGFAATPGPFTLDAAAAVLIDAAGADDRRVHLCGLSLGGAVAIRAASTCPDRFASLILCAAPIAPKRYQPANLRRYGRVPNRLAKIYSDAANWHTLIEALGLLDLEPELAQITVPTLVVCGARDRPSLPDARRLSQAIPGATVLILPHVGHSWPVHVPKVFDAVLTEFHTHLPDADSDAS